MERITKHITFFSNDDEYCLVDGQKERIGIVKNNFGDWELEGTQDEYARRRNKNISHYDYTFETVTVEEKKKEKAVFQEIAQEEEFPGLNTTLDEQLEQQIFERETEEAQCEGITKAGTRCKKDATEGAFCNLHAPKED